MIDNPLTNHHRHTLSRDWIGSGGRINWIMLNPSTANDWVDDPTIRKCVGFSKLWGYSEMVVTNLFTFKATHPKDLRECAKSNYARAVGLADQFLIENAHHAQCVVAAWGTHGNLFGRADDVMSRVLPDVKLHCIGLTKAGFPLHPVMAAYTPAPKEYR